jgi:hypothetical protein
MLNRSKGQSLHNFPLPSEHGVGYKQRRSTGIVAELGNQFTPLGRSPDAFRQPLVQPVYYYKAAKGNTRASISSLTQSIVLDDLDPVILGVWTKDVSGNRFAIALD